MKFCSCLEAISTLNTAENHVGLPTWHSNDVVGVVRGLLQKEVKEKTCYGKWAGKVSNRNGVLNCQGDRGTPPEGY
nr:hypothetical protein [Tanacetum cinerariifolium]